MAAEMPWYYESSGQQTGPVSEAALREMLATGRLSPQARVWRQGMADWQVARNVSELNSFPAAPTAGAAEALEPVEITLLVVLSVVTLGIYGAIRFYQASKAYQRIAGRSSNYDTLFWAYVALAAAGLVFGFALGPFGILLGIGSVVVAVLLLNEALELRAAVLRARGLRLDLVSDNTHRLLFIAGLVTSVIGVGLALLLVQGVFFFQDHNKMAAALSFSALPGGPSAAPPPPTPEPSPAAVWSCAVCGGPLASEARFCSRCGAPAA